MPDTVIKVENMSKLYHLGELHRQTNSFRDKVTHTFKRLVPNTKRKASSPVPTSYVSDTMSPASSNLQSSQSDDHIWALKDVSFEVKEGEVLGIIGRNGAGKSTLLKILSRITKPTQGKALVNGRIGSLLEVGTGFHPELTGRENIYLNGAILGMRKAEINRKFDEIVAFAEIEKFLDTPVKHYSSGMYVRLAFAVAAHMEPEILMVDEVLAVGDLPFQKKCLGKMGNVAKEGRTVLFVSHHMFAIRTLCTETVWLDDGQIIKIGPTLEVVKYYEEKGLSYSGALSPVVKRDDMDAKNLKFFIQSIEMMNTKSENTAVFSHMDSLILLVDFAGECRSAPPHETIMTWQKRFGNDLEFLPSKLGDGMRISRSVENPVEFIEGLF